LAAFANGLGIFIKDDLNEPTLFDEAVYVDNKKLTKISLKKVVSYNQPNLARESIHARYLGKSYQEARTYKTLQDDRLSKIWQEYLASTCVNLARQDRARVTCKLLQDLARY
jgi:hypothetical protein